MDQPLKLEVKQESIDIEEMVLPMEYLNHGENLDPLSANLEPEVCAEINALVSVDGSIPEAMKSIGYKRALKESNKLNEPNFLFSLESKKFELSKRQKLHKKESLLKIKESILAMREASIKCKEDILKIKEANLAKRESKLLKIESKALQSKKSKLQKKLPKGNPQDKKENPELPMKHCNICNKTLKYKTWISHMREVHSPTTYICYCKRFFHAKRTYERHIQHVHNKVKRYPKPTPNVQEHKCTKCNISFNHPYRLKVHDKNVHSGEGKDIYCEICDSKLRSQTYLQAHMSRVHYDDGKAHSCGICGKKFESPRYVRIHIKNSHEKHGLKVQSRKMYVLTEEKDDWNIENKQKSKRKNTRKHIRKSEMDWEIQNENENSNNRPMHEIKLELDEDEKGYTLKEVILSPQQNCNIEIREVKLENM